MALPTTIKYSFWLRFSAAGHAPSASKNPPSLAADERGMHCVVELPRALFMRPQLTASIRVDEIPERTPLNIDIAAAETALSEVLGVDVLFTVKPAADS